MDEGLSQRSRAARRGSRRGRPPIAIIGLSGRYPGGANNPAQLWLNLKQGRDGVSERLGERWDPGYFNPDPKQPGRIYTRRAGLLDRIDLFDADFFGISPREAIHIDPQQRLLLELAWEALEDAALVPKQLAGAKVGVFIGIAAHDYADLQGNVPRMHSAHTNSGGALSIAANRISYIFDFRGPSFAVDTACSSALVAIHNACMSLWSGESSAALAGGVNVLANPLTSIGFCNASMLSRTGRCHSFDAAADGYVRAEGGGIVVLKPLDAAERDGDPIHALIVGSGVNSDGHTQGLSMPNEFAQEALLRQVYGESGIAPDEVAYIESHGTGTPVGDPIECNAIGRVLGVPRRDGRPCLIGSIKSNIGHLETAAGIAGLTKVLLALRHRELPANLHFNTPNPKIAFDELNLKVVDRPIRLPKRGKPLVMGVSSYGFGGTNAHLAIREYRRPAERGLAAMPLPRRAASDRVLLLSARRGEALAAMATDYAALLRAADPGDLDAICATAALHRARHPHRLAVSGAQTSELAVRLERFAAGELAPRLASARVVAETPRLAFVFSGNGPQWWGMGRELLAASPLFRAELERIDAVFQRLAGWSLIEEMALPEAGSRMAKTEVAQPALFALQLGLVRLLDEAGVRPAAVLGHSVGEVAAAYASGALGLEQAVSVIFERSRAQAATAGTGKMAAIGLGREAAEAAIAEIPGWLEIAAVNSGRSVTVAGAPDALDALGRKLTDAGIFNRVLALDYPFHSRAMDAIEAPLRAALDELRPRPALLPFVSAVEGREIEGGQLDATYWWRNIREPVRFAAAVDHLLADLGVTLFLEIGPHPVLRDYVLQCAKDRDAAATVVPTLRRPSEMRPEPELDNLWGAVCACHANGVTDPSGLFERPAVPAALPSYPWQRQSFWNGVVRLPDTPTYSRRDHPLLGYRIAAGEALWENTLDTTLLPFLADHVVQGAVVYPATAYVEMVLAGAARVFGPVACDIEDFDIRKPLVIPSGEMPFIQLALNEEDGSFTLRSRLSLEAPTWTLLVVGKVSRAPGGAAARTFALAALRERMGVAITKEAHYRVTAGVGLSYGPSFQAIELIHLGDDEALGEIRVPAGIADDLPNYAIHPCLFDACLQALGHFDPKGTRTDLAYLPVQIRRVRSYATGKTPRLCYVRVTRRSPRSIMADVNLLDGDGRVIAEVEDIRFVGVDFSRGAGLPLYSHAWQIAERGPALLALPPLPSPSVLAERLRATIEALVTKFERAAFYEEIQPRFDRLAAAWAARALASLGARQSPFSVASLMARGRVLDEHRRYLEQLVVMAEADGLIDADPAGWVMPEERALPDPLILWRELFGEFPAFLAELSLLAHCGEHIAAILRGELDESQSRPAENGGSALDHFYDTAPSLRIYHHITRAILAELVRARPTEHRFRILEIGGGTGGLTAHLLPILPPERTDYLFTDVSPALLARAEHRFGAGRFIRFGALDIERDPADQGLPAGGFDLVICADVLHLAADLRQALGHVKALLAPNGQLLVLEQHGERFVDLIFGRAKDWWKFSDSDLRPNSALLPPDAWRRVLAEAGFAETASFSDAEAVPAGFIQGSPQHTIFLSQLPPAAASVAPAPEIARGEQSWLLLADAQGGAGDLARSTAALLRRAGHRVSLGELGDGYAQSAPDRFVVAPDRAEDFAALLAALDAAGHGCDQIVHLAGMAPCGERSAADLSALQDVRCLSTVLLIQALKNAGVSWTPRLTLVTSHAVAPPSGVGAGDPGQAPLWGLGRVVMNEHPGLGCRLIDLQLDLADPGAPHLLAGELARSDAETEVLLLGQLRYVARLRATGAAEQASLARHRKPVQRAKAQDPPQAFRLDFNAHGLLSNLYIAALERKSPKPGEVEIRVRAAGLNFRDVMWVMGMLPEEALENGFAGPTIGMECSGEIAALGEGVTGFTVGDRVIAFAPDCFATYVNTPASAVSPMPQRLGFEAAATIPSVFFTAYYALHHLARLVAGESVLIHGAAGGVGLAAIQIAKRHGATIFGTAGSPEKRDILLSLGVDHVLDSRSLDFADAVMRLTEGQGIDVVLNSLAGEAIAKNLQILKPFGRFLEIGKRDLYANSKIGLRPFRNNLSYFGIDADSLMSERSDLAQRLMGDVVALFETGALHPLPYRSFPISRAGDAFRQMQQSRHVGKLVITMDEDEPDSLPIVPRAATVRGDATYLVSGGLSGFGLATARWLVDKGARHLALLGRRGAATADAQAGIAAIEAAGAAVRVFATDVADEAALAEAMTHIRREMPPLRGVIHAAMVLDDCVIQQLDRVRLHRVLAPKMLGAWNLHRATLDRTLDFFVLYSSISSVIGNAGQANYAAANLYLESLAEFRRGQGLPALAVEWGPLAEVGYLARNVEISEMMRNRTGLAGISPRQALAELDRLLAAGATSVCVAQLDWQRLAQIAPSAALPKFSLLVSAASATESGSSVEELRERLIALPFAEQKDYVVKRLKEHFARVLGTTAAQIDAERPLSEMGLDSLMAVELGEVIERDLKIIVPVMELIQSGTVAAIALRVLKLAGISGDPAAASAGAAVEPADA